MASFYEFIKNPLSDFYGFISFYLFINTLFYIMTVPIKRLTDFKEQFNFYYKNLQTPPFVSMQYERCYINPQIEKGNLNEDPDFSCTKV